MPCPYEIAAKGDGVGAFLPVVGWTVRIRRKGRAPSRFVAWSSSGGLAMRQKRQTLRFLRYKWTVMLLRTGYATEVAFQKDLLDTIAS